MKQISEVPVISLVVITARRGKWQLGLRMLPPHECLVGTLTIITVDVYIHYTILKSTSSRLYNLQSSPRIPLHVNISRRIYAKLRIKSYEGWEGAAAPLLYPSCGDANDSYVADRDCYRRSGINKRCLRDTGTSHQQPASDVVSDGTRLCRQRQRSTSTNSVHQQAISQCPPRLRTPRRRIAT